MAAESKQDFAQAREPFLEALVLRQQACDCEETRAMKSCCGLVPHVAYRALMPCPMRKPRFTSVFVGLPYVPYDFLKLQCLIGYAQIQKKKKSIPNPFISHLYFYLFFHTGNNSKKHRAHRAHQ